MARGPRIDYPGAWHHVMNRGIARRTVFEGRRDVECFLGLLAAERAAGRLEVHAYAVLTTHFHLLVRSPGGEMAEAMRRVQNGYVRAFNRGRRRDGALFRGRYGSRVVESNSYLETLLRYIDLNAVEAGLVARARDYPFGSAWHYARHAPVPWLAREVVESLLGAPGAPWDPGRYPDWTPAEGLEWVADVVERRLRQRRGGADPWDDLVRAGPAVVQSWMDMKARAADGTGAGLVLVSAEGVLREARRVVGGGAVVERLAVGLRRDVSGLSLDELAARWRRSTTWVRTRVREHEEGMTTDPAYRGRAAAVVSASLAAEAGRFGSASALPLRPPETDGCCVRTFPHRGPRSARPQGSSSACYPAASVDALEAVVRGRVGQGEQIGV